MCQFNPAIQYSQHFLDKKYWPKNEDISTPNLETRGNLLKETQYGVSPTKMFEGMHIYSLSYYLSSVNSTDKIHRYLLSCSIYYRLYIVEICS